MKSDVLIKLSSFEITHLAFHLTLKKYKILRTILRIYQENCLKNWRYSNNNVIFSNISIGSFFASFLALRLRDC
jgi:hypothetical protein